MKRWFSRFTALTAALVFGLMLLAGPAQAGPLIHGFITVDDFTDDGGAFPTGLGGTGLLLTGPSMSGSVNNSGLSGVLGGTRNASLSTFADSDPNGNARLQVKSAPNRFSYSNDDGVHSTATLDYPNIAAGLAAGLGAGFHVDPNGSLAFNFFSNDLNLRIFLTLKDGNGHTFTDSSTTIPPGPGTFEFTLANFAAHGVDVTNLADLSLKFNPDLAGDLSLLSFQLPTVAPPPPPPPGVPVPEPASLAVWGALGGLGLWRVVRRRRLSA